MDESRSAIIVTVRPALVGWVRGQGIQRPYHREEDAVWLIPSVSSLASTGKLESYIESLHSVILDAELERFGRDLRDRILRDHSFDDLLELTIRDHVTIAPAVD